MSDNDHDHEDTKPRAAPKGRMTIDDVLPVTKRRLVAVQEQEQENDIDSILNKELKEQANDLKRLRLQRYFIEEQDRLEEALSNRKQKKVERIEEEKEEDLKIEDVKAIAELDPEKRDAIIKTYTMMKAAGKTKGDLGLLLPLMLGMGANGKSTSEIKDFAESFITALQTGIQLAAPKDGGSTTEAILMKLLDAQLSAKKESGESDFFATLSKMRELGLVMTPQDYQQMASAGGLANKAAADLQKEIELERIRSQEKVELAKIGKDLHNTEKLEMLVNRGLKAAAEALGEKEADNAVEPKPQPESQPQQQPNVATARCPNCNVAIQVPVPEKERDITCGNCGAVSHWKNS